MKLNIHSKSSAASQINFEKMGERKNGDKLHMYFNEKINLNREDEK